ncbi:hypothetical protein HMPREF1487_09348 [Pseudomonas sp. HPB0071]|uniref:Fic family protein n=2 Tax=Pseudomonas TaxID=286 RepID=A0ABS0MYA6_PSELU|nr:MULTISPECIES: Fic family protein [Pseudomonas]ENA27135.1 hypothetical protein HMPREF1487_09348 [Pseudomonas sp. HPB0071]MBA1250076.1 Fic family protein [Pseudomonas zeshuii]MBH3441706.1 Fic family protein [Pseudomonas luteola]
MRNRQRLYGLLAQIDQGIEVLNNARPLPSHTVASLRAKLALDWTYHSNAIEGNTLTLRETKVVLEGITVGGKSIVEHLEAINHSEAIHYIEDIVANQEPLSEWQIRNIHSVVLKGIDQEHAGVYRQENVVISGASTIPPDHLQLRDAMADLIDWYQSSTDLHPVERAAQLHTRFVKIHPFVDGNGRTARLLLNFELMRNGITPAIINEKERATYYEALDEACVTGDFTLITVLSADAALRSLDLYLNVLGLSHGQDQAPDHVKPKGPGL